MSAPVALHRSPGRTGGFEVITMGRVGVDIYPEQVGVGLEDVTSFAKFLGGSATNVAVAASRLGHRAAVVTRTGDDPFGRFIHRALAGFGVDDRWVTPVDHLPTPVVFCELLPPDDFPLYFYRFPKAPDLEISPDELDYDAIRSAEVLWITLTGLSQSPSREAHLAALEARRRSGTTVLDLDYRPMFWDSESEATEQVHAALPHVTVAIGNREECRVAVGETEPDAVVTSLHDAGVDLAVVKQGPAGVLGSVRLADGTLEQVVVPPVPVEVVNGLGAGDAFGGAFVHGLLTGRDLRSTLTLANGAGSYVAGQLSCADAMPSVAQLDWLPRAGRSPAMTDLPPTRVTAEDIARLVTLRTTEPHRVAEAAAQREQPTGQVGSDGRLMLIAADHPARGALRAGDDPLAMGDRAQLLDRLVRALARPGVHGVLGTADILDDLLLLGALEGKVVIGSMNRGGLAGTVFEMDDRFTGFDAATIASDRYQGGKMLLRIDPDDHTTVDTLQSCASAVADLAGHRLMAMVEPFISARDGSGRVRNDLSTEAVVRSIGVAAGLAPTSAYTWLKLPVIEDMETVLAASTLPVLLLGGEVSTDQTAQLASWSRALACPTVRGMVVGTLAPLPPRRRRREGGRLHRGDVVSGLVLRHGATGTGPFVLEITPRSAGWAHSGLRVVELAAGEDVEVGTDGSEVVVISLSGSAQVGVDDRSFDLLGRESVFDGPSDAVYAPRDSLLRVSSVAGGRFALCSARCERRLEPAYVARADVPVELRGAGRASRQVHNFAVPAVLDADRIIACEVLTPAGNWSSWPPHKHDEERPGETELEEIYYFEVADGPGGPGMAYQRVYGHGGADIDLLEEVRTGDAVLIPHGWHGPSMAAPGYDLYYLNVMAGPGPERRWLICDDPAHAWVRTSWADEVVDPRLPFGTDEEALS